MKAAAQVHLRRGRASSRLARLACPLLLLCAACSTSPEGHRDQGQRPRLVFEYQSLGAEPGPFQALLNEFQAAHPEVELVPELLPNDSGVAHQFFLTALESGGRGMDVFVVDAVWVSEFARAGWVADLSAEVSPASLRATMLPGAAEAVIFQEHTYAVPWYVDVGLLYYRKDLVPRAPRTFEELRAFARAAQRRQPGLQGYLWQGRQYEGLVCNVYETIWGMGGETMRGGRLALDNPEAAAALALLRSFIVEGTSPAAVTSATEEESRRVFQQGRAVFMRNWPYAWDEAQREDSPIRGKVGIAALPTATGAPGAGTLGGWQLALRARLPPAQRRAALALIAHLTSPAAQRLLALRYGRNPPTLALYRDPQIVREAPQVASLLPFMTSARPRPVTPYYSLLSDTLQSEFSAAVSGVRSPPAALHRAQQRADQMMGSGP